VNTEQIPQPLFVVENVKGECITHITTHSGM